ncbi:hypothetical protein Dimus_000070 [Dionaea muscipula]
MLLPWLLCLPRTFLSELTPPWDRASCKFHWDADLAFAVKETYMITMISFFYTRSKPITLCRMNYKHSGGFWPMTHDRVELYKLQNKTISSMKVDLDPKISKF